MEIKKAYSSFSVTDVSKAKEFYANTLGLNAIEDTKMGGILTLTISDHSVMIYPKSDHIPATFTVLNLIVGNVEATVDELTAKGIKFEMYDNEWIKTDSKGISKDGPIIAWFKDPFGNFISLIEE
jgi:predicted enzyme related to lactoylglutathione lyase